jgi:hypothetical protein
MSIGVKFITFLGNIVVLGHASNDNSSALGSNVALYSLDAKISIAFNILK